jgi:hypothetical protein
MLPNPLHPAVVHFPIVLMLFLPVIALVTLWAIRRGANARWAWAIPFVVAGLLTLSSWVSVETGEEQSERVERVVPEQPMESHEEFAEVFFMLSGAVLAVAAAGMLNGRIGHSSRVIATFGRSGSRRLEFVSATAAVSWCTRTAPRARIRNRARRPRTPVAIADRESRNRTEKYECHSGTTGGEGLRGMPRRSYLRDTFTLTRHADSS